MRAFLKHIGWFLILLMGCATLLSEGSLFFLRHSSFYKPSFVANALKQKAYDYIVLGSSIGLTTLNTKVIDNASDLEGVNLSMDDTGIGTQCLMLEHFLAQGKSTKYCVLSASVADLNTKHPGLSVNNYRFLPYIRRNYVSSYFNEFKEGDANIILWSKYFSFAGVFYYNLELFYPSILSAFRPNMKNRFDGAGNYQYPLENLKGHEKLTFTTLPINLQNPYLERLNMLCKENNITLVVYIPPMKGKNVVFLNDNYKVINHSAILDDAYFFYDPIHVNLAGNKQVSLKFAEDLKLLIKGLP
ncbi:hypothetical protein [Aestuariivivens sediminis]|uniref:hypothetical protein n=1 Tax=Aestuariivivens sediminis TaxID=2913557 RepID=UPI001F59E558|nr:hypothetical protein [Aestuariivivens sediminis]